MHCMLRWTVFTCAAVAMIVASSGAPFARAQAKKSRNFAEADRIRDELLHEGIILEDTKDGVRWKRK